MRLLFISLFIFNDFGQANFLNLLDRSSPNFQGCSRTMTVDDQCEILVLPSVEGRCHGSRILLVLAHGCRWTQVASGAAGRVNVGFCPASSLQRCAEDISSAARNDSWKYLEKYGDYRE